MLLNPPISRQWGHTESKQIAGPLIKGISTLSNCAILETDERGECSDFSSLGLDLHLQIQIKIQEIQEVKDKAKHSSSAQTQTTPTLLIQLIWDQTETTVYKTSLFK